MRLLVETTGPFQLLDHDGRKLIRFQGCTVVTKTSFIESRAAAGQLLVRAQLGMDATDEEWLKFAKESGDDTDLAIASFVSTFPVIKAAPAAPAAPPPPPMPPPPAPAAFKKR